MTVFFKRDIPSIQQQFRAAGIFPNDVSGIVVSYMVNQCDPFGAAEWMRYFKMDVGEEPPFSGDFETFWYAPDPIDSSQRVSDTHLPPILAPQFFTNAGTKKCVLRNLKSLQELGLRYIGGMKKITVQAGPSCWLVMRKNIVNVDDPSFIKQKRYEGMPSVIDLATFIKQRGYEGMPSVIDLATVVTVRKVWTGERYLGDETGIEKRTTFSFCRELHFSEESSEIFRVGISMFSMNNKIFIFFEDIDLNLGRRAALAALKKC